jgi:xylose isomerase
MLVLLKYGLAPGGVNFDAKMRRESFEPIDLFYAHIGSMDAFAKGLKIAARMIEENALSDMVKHRYSSWDGEFGQKIEAGKTSFAELEAFMLQKGEPTPNGSGRQELLEHVFNRYIDRP